MEPRELNHDELLRLYESVVKEEHFFLESYHTRVGFHATVITALYAGTGVGLFQASEWYHYAYLTAGPLAAMGVAQIARQATRRTYQRFLEAVSTRAKLEGRLGMLDARSDSRPWPNEALVPSRHLVSRTASASSQAFVESNLGEGTSALTRRFFYVLQIASGLSVVGLASAAIGSIR